MLLPRIPKEPCKNKGGGGLFRCNWDEIVLDLGLALSPVTGVLIRREDAGRHREEKAPPKAHPNRQEVGLGGVPSPACRLPGQQKFCMDGGGL